MNKKRDADDVSPVIAFREAVLRLAELETQVAAQRALVEDLQASLMRGSAAPVPSRPRGERTSSPRTIDRSRPSLVAVRDAIAQHGGSAKIEDVARLLNLQRGAAAVRLQRACQVGLLTRSSHGIYQVVEEAPAT